MIRIFTVTLALLALSGGAPAVLMQHGLHVEVQADRIVIGPETVPRFALRRATATVVPAGQMWFVDATAPFDTFEVHGTLVVAPGTTRIRDIQVMPGGRLDRSCTSDVAFKDLPLDADDVFQLGNSILNLGHHESACGVKTPFVESEPASAGANVLVLRSVPEGWLAGDELLLPDSRQINQYFRDPSTHRRESVVTIASISGTTVGLSKPLDFEHLAVNRPDGSGVVYPRVANLTRATTIRSENPDGVRGHTIDIGPASANVIGTQYVGIGRTLNQPDGPGDGNQRGRYAIHMHHMTGAGNYTGNSILDAEKWALAIHGVGGKHVEANVCVDADGGCFVTEDGPEAGVVITRNFAAYVSGSSTHRNSKTNPGLACSGCEGSAFWLRGLKDLTLAENEAWNSEIGINLFNFAHVGLLGSPRDQVPRLLSDNVTAANRRVNLEYWGVPRVQNLRHVAVNAGERNIWAGTSGDNHLFFKDVTVISSPDADRQPRSAGIAGNAVYVPFLEVDGGEVRGHAVGVGGGGAIVEMRLKNVVFQNETNIEYPQFGFPLRSVLDHVRHEPFRDFQPRYVVFGSGVVWQPGQPIETKQSDEWKRPLGWAHVVINWQGDGNTYRIMQPQQARSAPAWPAVGSLAHLTIPPVCGSTMGQSWDACGLAFGGEAYTEPGFTREGLINGALVLGGEVPLGMPRLVMTVPNTLASAVVSGGQTDLIFQATGDPSISPDGRASIDGGAPVTPQKVGLSPQAYRIRTSAVSSGSHTVQTWRVDTLGQPILGSEKTFPYFVRDTPPPPPDDPPPPDSVDCSWLTTMPITWPTDPRVTTITLTDAANRCTATRVR